MPVEEFGGGPVTSTKPKPKPKPGKGRLFPTAPTAPSAPIRPGQVPAGSSAGGGNKSGDKGRGKGGAGGGYDPAKAEARAIARANAEKNKAADRYVLQAQHLEAQARALKSALNRDLKKGLLQQLGDVTESRNQQGQVLREGFRDRMAQLRGSSRDNTKAQAQQSGINQLNVARERNSALSEAMSQGAGESDVLRSMMMSLRNWNANQSEVDRGYFDTLRSIQSSQTDLETDTKTALVNNAAQANADKEQLFTNYYNQRSELYTQLGNTRGQQADYFAMADEMRVAKEEAKEAAKKSRDKDKGRDKGAGKGADRPNLGTKGGGGAAGGPGTTARAAGRPEGRKARREALGPFEGPGHRKVSGVPENSKQAFSQSRRAFMQASKAAGRSWDNPGVPESLLQWEGQDPITGQQSNLNRLDTVTGMQLERKKPEGAVLRKWD